MREILFRGKRIDNGEWVEGYLYLTHNSEYEISFYNAETNIERMSYVVIPETVGQYTGLTDKNGKRIFEGDICCFREWTQGAMCWIGKVHYVNQLFAISGGKNEESPTPFFFQMSRLDSKDVEVIGNIHDNSELLKGENK